jgi:FKBP-type peptidyl-prolyl cis-trans isomerase
VKATSVPTVVYTTKLINGIVVGTSFGPTDFDHRELKNHIPGWQIGLQKISRGGKIRLYIPPVLAYGSIGVAGVIPPDAILISDIELVSIK